MVSTNHTPATKIALQRASQAVGAVFLLVGILGFIPGITTNYESLGMAGHASTALLLGSSRYPSCTTLSILSSAWQAY
ncbi:DUF4383 domain-containing protein [Arthrobacter sp. OVS8]|nr:DUF4383 domain-containing protein [Arthrobacter sp. OVS8]